MGVAYSSPEEGARVHAATGSAASDGGAPVHSLPHFWGAVLSEQDEPTIELADNLGAGE